MMKYWLDIKVLELFVVRNLSIQKTELCLFQNWLYSARRYKAYATVGIYKNHSFRQRERERERERDDDDDDDIVQHSQPAFI